MSEDRLQQDCYCWFHNEFRELRGLLFHVPNGGNRSGREGAKFKAMGVFPGVSDFILFYKGEVYCIELKVDNGKQSAKQKSWEKTVKRHGMNYNIVWSLQQFQDLIESIIRL